MPVLALNQPEHGENPPPGSAAFALTPDSEAAQAAQHRHRRTFAQRSNDPISDGLFDSPVIVAVTTVRMVEVPAHEIVRVPGVRHTLMAAICPMHVGPLMATADVIGSAFDAVRARGHTAPRRWITVFTVENRMKRSKEMVTCFI